MPTKTKLDHYTDLLQQSVSGLNEHEKWQSFLETASRLYKYKFREQIMIHAQKPTATACADYDLWRRKDLADRQVKAGSKGIALLEDNGNRTNLRYVFDYADTEARSEKKLFLWQITNENENAVTNMLSKKYGADDKNMYSALLDTAKQLANEYGGDYANELIDYTEGTFLEELDDFNVWVEFSQTLENSIAYTLLARCGYNAADYFDMDDFQHLRDFNGIGAMTVLGKAVSELSEQALRDIERTVKTFERNKQHEQSISQNNNRETVGRNGVDVHTGRGNADLPPESDDRGIPDNRVLRQDEGEIPQREQADPVRDNVHQGNAESALDGHRTASEGLRDRTDNADGEVGERGREIEIDQSNGVGTADEQLQAESEGDSPKRNDIHLTADEYGGFLPSEHLLEILKHDKNMNVKKPQVLDYFLAHQGNEHDNAKERADFMRLAYSLDFTTVEVADRLYAYQKTDDGLQIHLGGKKTAIPWETVQEHVTDLIAKHEYLDEPKIDIDIANTAFNEAAFFMPEPAQQMSLFGDDVDYEPQKSTKVTAFSTDDERIIKADLMRGSSFQDGKIRIEEFAKTNPSTADFAKFLSKEYGIGGSSIDAGFSNHDGKGIRIDFYDRENGEYQKTRSITLNWNQVAKRIAELVKNGEYITDDDIQQRIKHAEYVLNNYDPTNSLDLRQIEEAEKVLTLYGLFEEDNEELDVTPRLENAEEMQETPINLAPETEEEPDEYVFKVGDVLELDEGIFEVTQVDGDIIELTDTTTDETCVINENELYNTGFAVIEEAETSTNQIDFLSKIETAEVVEIPQDEIDPLSLIGKHYVIDGREMIVEKVDTEWNSVSFADVQMFQTGYPIFRSETVDFLLYIERQEREKADIDITDIAVTELETELPEPEPFTASEPPKSSIPKGENFRINDDNLGIGGAKEKFKNNIAAITLLKEIENDFNRVPTKDEQETLSKYVGWGGLAQAFDEKNSAWADEYLSLKNTLSDFEYDSARESTLNAHYTSPTVIKAIYEGLQNLGFKSGNVLEPSMGVGNFFGLMPETMSNSKLYGVELDDVSGRIAKQLYPKADISIRGFEDKQFSDNFFDVAVGNVPFGGYKLSEKRYDKLNLNIHDHFFAKALDKVRPGGVIAFVTSKGTLDKQNPSFRKYLAERAELLGAIRLPNTAFKANAGTEVTSDMIFLQKRDSVMDIEPDWIKLGKTADGIAVNQYFLDNPEMLLGTMSNDSGTRMYGNENSTTCLPFEGADLAEQLKAAIANIKGNIPEYEHDDDEKVIDSIPADESVRNFSFTLVDEKLYYRENSRMNRIEFPKATEERIKAMVELRDCVRTLIDYQLNEYGETDIRNQQFKLNNLYDKFSKKHGLINSQANKKAFGEDSSYYLLTSLEVLNEQGELERKADMFTKRTIKQRKEITHVDTASEALAVSIAEKASVNLDFMQALTGFDKDRIIEDLSGVIYKVPLMNDTEKYVTADEYLSGNIREKLETARNISELKGGYEGNIKALEQVMPKPLEACDIDVRLGVNWIDPEYIKQFICETLQVPFYVKNSLEVRYSNYTAEWHVDGKNNDTRNVLANMTFGTGRKNAYSIIEDTLNLRDVRIYDYEQQLDGSKKAILNKKETMLAQEKQEAVKGAFKDWIFKEPNRRADLVEKYNVMFNSTRPREYDGSHITFSGMNPEITLNPHQRNAVAHALYGGNTLFAHCVGAGKTFEMVATAMESKRLGLCNKSLICVPNHITEQIGSDFLRLYPSANILVATKKDFETKNRRRLCAKIACGDYDAVIIGHSQLEKIPVSPERQERLLRKQIHDITAGIEDMKYSRGEKFTVKQLEKTKKSLESRLKKLIEAPKRDDVVTFEELGVDKLFLDESHFFKNLFLYTKMRNVAGIQQSEAQKSTDLYLKCQYLDELTDGKGLTFSTGTPISNSMTEMYTVMRYLQSDMLRKHNLEHFDSWAATFGETQTSMELAPEGGGYRARTRFAKFFNLPELMNIFKEVADIKTSDMLPDLKVPDVTFHNVVVQPTEHQKEMVADLSERAKLVQQKAVPPERDNMLCITNDGRKIGLDQRLMNPLLPDEPGTKVNVCVDNVQKIWTDTADNKSAQLIFCDFSTPKNDGKFNVYDDIRDKLVTRGVPKKEIAFIHEYDSEEKKKELFAKVRKGDVRVLLGSTGKCGSGTNVQNKLIALHDLDAPWRPADLEQRLGRIKRQGNENPSVSVFRYVTENTFDSYLYQTLENKQRFISQVMTSKSPVRSCDDVDEATLSYAEVKALCAGNPLIKEKIDLDVSVAKLKALKANHVNEQYRLEDNVLKYFPDAIRKTENRIKGYESDTAHLKSTQNPIEGISPMTIMGVKFTDKEQAGKAIIEACKQLKSKETLDIGTYKGFDMSVYYDSFDKTFHLELKRDMTYSTTLGTDPHGNITRVNNVLENIPKLLENSQSQLETLHSQLETAKGELGKPFSHEGELNTKISRLAELNIQLNIEGKQEVQAVDKSEAAAEKSADKPPKSIHDKMKFYKEISDKQNGDKPPKLGKDTQLQ